MNDQVVEKVKSLLSQGQGLEGRYQICPRSQLLGKALLCWTENLILVLIFSLINYVPLGKPFRILSFCFFIYKMGIIMPAVSKV